jgi:hypothetical protein
MPVGVRVPPPAPPRCLNPPYPPGVPMGCSGRQHEAPASLHPIGGPLPKSRRVLAQNGRLSGRQLSSCVQSWPLAGERHKAAPCACELCGSAGTLEQDRFRLNHFAQRPMWRLKRESCSTYRVQSEIHVPGWKPQCFHLERSRSSCGRRKYCVRERIIASMKQEKWAAQ